MTFVLLFSHRDLSFNKLNGEIPNLDGLTNVEVMYTHLPLAIWVMEVATSLVSDRQRLNGNIPDGIKGRQSRTEIDLSYSNFSEQSALPSCRDSLQELFLRDQYEGGAAKFHPMIDYWGFSSTGHFWDHNRTINDYIAQNGKLESKDFDIVQAAQGVEKVVVKEFKAVVKNKTLEVRFHWAGKGQQLYQAEELMVLSYQLFLWNLVSLGLIHS
ncbi:hypothetical protein CK203_111180 [Vitis vinifera]|uniref:Malectin domain-containing protein n=1 Tax=Vitis vinifera TaxID=29760 RepID=A0A438BLX4_VITVI|nr:hypothetical protein CK203_111180 [Vitis vinifera]